MSARASCHGCGNDVGDAFYRVEGVPVHSCLLVPSRTEALGFPTGDLSLVSCPRCGLIQNAAFDPGVPRYSPDYEETQSFSPTFAAFARDLCASQIERYGLEGKTVLEIGCGKGEFLVSLCEMGVGRGIGIDPGYRPERTRSQAGARIEFIQDFYSEKYAHLQADYLCCRHTLEHIQPVREFVRMIRGTLAPETVVFFEVPDVGRVLDERAFWDVYYEHCSYFTAGSLARLFRSCDFDILDLYRGYADQYLMIEARPLAGRTHRRFDGEDDLEEVGNRLRHFRATIGERLAVIRERIEGMARRGERVVLWGSGSKAVSFLTTLGIRDEVEYVVDINPHRQGSFLPGTGQRIVMPDFLKTYRPQAVIVMNPIYCEEIGKTLDRLGVSARLIPISEVDT